MARRRREIQELQERIRALPPEEQAEVVRGVMTPAMRFGLLVEQAWKEQRRPPPRAIAKAVHDARREAEREHAARRPGKRDRKRAS